MYRRKAAPKPGTATSNGAAAGLKVRGLGEGAQPPAQWGVGVRLMEGIRKSVKR